MGADGDIGATRTGRKNMTTKEQIQTIKDIRNRLLDVQDILYTNRGNTIGGYVNVKNRDIQDMIDLIGQSINLIYVCLQGGR